MSAFDPAGESLVQQAHRRAEERLVKETNAIATAALRAIIAYYEARGVALTPGHARGLAGAALDVAREVIPALPWKQYRGPNGDYVTQKRLADLVHRLDALADSRDASERSSHGRESTT